MFPGTDVPRYLCSRFRFFRVLVKVRVRVRLELRLRIVLGLWLGCALGRVTVDLTQNSP